MAYTVMAYIPMAYTIGAYVVMANNGIAYIDMAYIMKVLMACIVVA